MKRSFFLLGFVFLSLFLLAQKREAGNSKSKIYFPPYGEWEHRTALASGFDTGKLSAAILFAIENESKAPRNMEIAHAMSFGKEPFGEAIGPFSARGNPTGVIVHKGYIIAEWGEPGRVDMTFSVTKSFLSSVIGLAVDRKMIRSVNDTVSKYLAPMEIYKGAQIARPAEEFGKSELLTPFATFHNKAITWDNLLRQVSDWEGTLWGKPEWADRPDTDTKNWLNRSRKAPGTVYEYNDVRVNALALAATSVWRRPLPQVLKEYLMDPIGASATWRWYGYRNSWIILDGQLVQSVSGGGHWGGGMFINAYDMARYGLLTLHKGYWNGQQLLSRQWIDQSLMPTPAQPTYGYMNFFLNSVKKYLPSAPSSAFVHVGNGTNIIYVDPENELVLVVRWIENRAVDGMVKQVLEAVKR